MLHDQKHQHDCKKSLPYLWPLCFKNVSTVLWIEPCVWFLKRSEWLDQCYLWPPTQRSAVLQHQAGLAPRCVSAPPGANATRADWRDSAVRDQPRHQEPSEPKVGQHPVGCVFQLWSLPLLSRASAGKYASVHQRTNDVVAGCRRLSVHNAVLLGKHVTLFPRCTLTNQNNPPSSITNMWQIVTVFPQTTAYLKWPYTQFCQLRSQLLSVQ